MAFLEGGGELGARMRGHDWTQTPLGPPRTWPRSLKTAVRIMLTSRQPFWIGWGPELTYLYNDPYKSIIGGKHPEALGQPFRRVWGEIWDVVGPMAERVMVHDDGTYVEAQLLIMERHGYREETYYTFSYSPVPDDDGNVGGLICANTDDTRRVIGERQLATLRAAATAAADARTWREACDRGVEAATRNDRDVPFVIAYAFADERAEPVVAACSPGTDALLDPAWWDLSAGVEPQGVQCVEVRAAPGDVPPGAWAQPPSHAAVVPLRSWGKAGRRGALVIGLAPFRRFDEGYRGFVELLAKQIAAGIANADAYAQERRRAEALAELDRAKTEFFSNVSHEFRTPLTLMLGPLQETLARAERLPDDDRTRLEIVHRSAMRLLKLVNTLLDFSRIEAGRAEACYLPTDLGTLTSELASTFRSTIEHAGLELELDTPSLDEPTYVDREMWEKIVFNLLSNAFKFTFDGSIRVRLSSDEQNVRLSVRDTGTGIDSDELPQIFERFHRTQSTRGRTFEGSGIGLSLVQELVRLHGGTIDVHSVVDVGSEFTVCIPRGAAHLPPDRIGARPRESSPEHAASFVEEATGWQPRSHAQQPANNPGRGATRVLVADDNADMLEYLRSLLSEHYEVDAVPDGRRALASARMRRPDLVLADVMMPELDGFGLLRELRSDPELAMIPFVMVSARAGEEARVEGLDAGADDYLVKPFSARELLARVSARIELSRLQARVVEGQVALQRVFAQAPIPIAVLGGPELVFELANPAFREAVSGRELVAEPLLEAIPELTGQGFDRILREVMRTGEPFIGSETLVMLERQGRPQPTHWTFVFAPLRGEDEEIDRVVAIGTDVTGQVDARRATQRSEARYRYIFRTAGVSIWEEDFSEVKAALDRLARKGVTDVRRYCEEHPQFVDDAIDMVRVVDVNDLTVRMFGAADKSELIGPLRRIFVPETRGVFVEELVALAERRALLESEVQLRTLSGEPLDLLFTIAFPSAANEFDSVLVTLVDITDRKRVEASLRESDRRKDEFIAMLSHELRNPLAALRSATQLVTMSRPEDPGLRRATEVLDRQSAHMTSLIDGLLDVSRVSRGKIVLERSAIDLVEVVRSVIASQQEQLGGAGPALLVRLPDEPAWVEGDRVRLTQVCDNLVGNAIKFTDPPGRVTVSLEQDANTVRLEVEDTGIGLRPEACSLIFEAFRQEGQDTARSAGGLGLGLALAKGLVELHGGTIEAHSNGLGTGTRLSVALPTTSRRNEVRNEPESSPPGPCRILLVEDNDDAALMLQALLEARGHEVAVATLAPDAFEILRGGGIDIVLCDLGLPGMDGYELAQAVRADPAIQAIPLVALTGYGQLEDRQRSAAAGFDLHLLKPVDPTKLDEALGTLSRRDPASRSGS